jgi:hypothetical protein
VKFLRVIRFDGSDDQVFARAAAGDEWAVSGAFEFAQTQESEIKGKLRQAFANGFLGVSSFGRSTFAHVSELSDAEEAGVCDSLVTHFIDTYDAPDATTAEPAARAEMLFVQQLCADKPVNTVFTVRRLLDDNGDIREEFREISPPSQSASHTKIWEVVDDEA